MEVLHILANLDDVSNGFVARDERELRDELALVDVRVGTADTATRDFEEDVVVVALGDWHLANVKVVWRAVVECAHGSLGHVGCVGESGNDE